MKTYEDCILEPVYVKDPYSNREVDVAPFLYTIHEYFRGFPEAEDEISCIIEDIASHITDEMLSDEKRMQNNFYRLVIIRRMLRSMHTGEMLNLP